MIKAYFLEMSKKNGVIVNIYYSDIHYHKIGKYKWKH